MIETPNTKIILRLIKGCKKNNREAQKLLYKEYYGYAISICIRYVTNRDEAVTVLNDAFMKLFASIKKFDTSYPLKAWFRRILINESINAAKKRAGRFKEDCLDEVLGLSETEGVISNIGHQEIVEMIQQLSPQYQTVFNLHVIEGYSHDEIAAQL